MRTPSGHVERHVTNLIVRRPFTRFYNLTTIVAGGAKAELWLALRGGGHKGDSSRFCKCRKYESSNSNLPHSRYCTSYYQYFEEESKY